MLSKILLNNTVCKFIEIKIDDYAILIDDIASLEIKHDFSNLAITGKLKFKDSFDISSAGLVKFNNKNKLTISIKDFSETSSFRSFVVTAANNVVINERVKVWDITFQDAISYAMQNTYGGVSFYGSAITCLTSLFDQMGINTILSTDKMTKDIVDTCTEREFTVPSNQTIYDFFVYQLRKDNIRIYQDRTTLHIKEVKPAKLIPAKDPKSGDDLVFTNNIPNNDYLFKIHDFMDFKNPAGKLNQLSPIIKVFSSVDTGVDTTTILLDDVFADLKLNDLEITGIQVTDGEKHVTAPDASPGAQKADLFDAFMKNQQMFIAVPGTLRYGNVGSIVSLDMKGGIAGQDTNLEGDVLTSGKYLVLGVSDRLIGDKFIQRLYLGRLDGKKGRTK